MKRKHDLSFEFFRAYSERPDGIVQFILRDGTVFSGVISGFVKGNPALNEPFVIRWHLVNEKDKLSLDFDPIGNRLGTVIEQEDVSEMKWVEW